MGLHSLIDYVCAADAQHRGFETELRINKILRSIKFDGVQRVGTVIRGQLLYPQSWNSQSETQYCIRKKSNRAKAAADDEARLGGNQIKSLISITSC